MTMILEIAQCEIRDRYTQKCRLSVSQMKIIGARLGSYLKIHDGKTTVVCSMWPSPDGNEGIIKFDSTVTTGLREINFSSFLEIIETSPCTRINVTLVVSKVDKVVQLKQNFENKRKMIEQFCKNCLLHICVVPESEVNLEHSRLAKCYGFSKLFIHWAQSEKDTIGSIIDLNTVVEIIEIISAEKYCLRKSRDVCWIGGLDQTTKDLTETIKLKGRCQRNQETLLELPTGVLLRGPPGCGKTTVVKQVAAQCDTFIVTINGPEILGPRPGESEENLRSVFSRAVCLSEEGFCILFIDELDSLCPKRGQSSGTQECRLTGQLCSLMDSLQSNHRLIVIGATNRPQALDPVIRRPGRFDREVMINVPSECQRKEILSLHTSVLPLDEDVDIRVISSWTKGYVGADLACLCREAAYEALAEFNHEKTREELVKVGMRHFKGAFVKTVPSTQKGSDAVMDLKPVCWEDIGGLEDVKLQIRQAVEWPMTHPEAFARLGIPHPRGILLYGPPGCCKTTLVRAAATSSKATFLSVSSAQLLSPFVGDAEKAVTEVFHRARMGAPSILFLDEVDAIAARRSESAGHRGAQERLLSTLLNEIDGVGVRLDEKFDSTLETHRMPEGDCIGHSPQEGTTVDNSRVLIVAATNRPDLIDEAMLRPGRLDRIIYVPPPDEQTRTHILNVHTQKMPVRGVDTSKLSRMTEFFSGADLENLCREAALLALARDGLTASSISEEHFTEVLNTVKPSLDESVINQYKHFQSHGIKLF